jgi:hypothetical protein
MTTRRILAALVAAVPLGLACGGGGGTTGNIVRPTPPINLNPRIENVVLNPGTVPWGGTAAITVTASDADGRVVSARYEVSHGTVTPDPGNPLLATYRHNGQGQPERLTVTVTDDRQGTDTRAADLPIAPQVVIAPTVSVSASPDSCHPRCTITFTATARNADSLTWSGCASGSGGSVQCVLDDVGTATAVCMAKNSVGEVSASASARGVNQRPSVTGGIAIKGTEAEFEGQYSDADGDTLTCTWWSPSSRGGCQKLGGCEDFSGPGGKLPGCKAGLPTRSGQCTGSVECRDRFGAVASTTWSLEN